MARPIHPPQGHRIQPPDQAQGLSTPVERVAELRVFSTESTFEFGFGKMQTQVLPTGMHLLRFVGDDGATATFVLGGHVFGFEAKSPKIDTLA